MTDHYDPKKVQIYTASYSQVVVAICAIVFFSSVLVVAIMHIRDKSNKMFDLVTCEALEREIIEEEIINRVGKVR